jgi:hypothetical protein
LRHAAQVGVIFGSPNETNSRIPSDGPRARAELRLLAYQRLTVMKNESVERITVGARKGMIAIFCEITDGERVAVVLRGKLDTWFSRVKSVARDGLYKHRDGSVTDMSDDELYDYDPRFSD